MNENIKKFMEAVSADKELENELKAAFEGVAEPKEKIAAVIDFAKAKGFELTEEDIIPKEQKINLDELDTVAGGGGGCGCAALGGGGGDGLVCVCIGSGAGAVDGISQDYDIYDQGGCLCVVAGGGSTK